MQHFLFNSSWFLGWIKYWKYSFNLLQLHSWNSVFVLICGNNIVFVDLCGLVFGHFRFLPAKLNGLSGCIAQCRWSCKVLLTRSNPSVSFLPLFVSGVGERAALGSGREGNSHKRSNYFGMRSLFGFVYSRLWPSETKPSRSSARVISSPRSRWHTRTFFRDICFGMQLLLSEARVTRQIYWAEVKRAAQCFRWQTSVRNSNTSLMLISCRNTAIRLGNDLWINVRAGQSLHLLRAIDWMHWWICVSVEL